MTKLIRGACILAFLFALISPVIGTEQAATAQEPSQDQAVLASSVKSGLTSAQRSLMLDDIPSAQEGMSSAMDAATHLSPSFVADPTAVTDLNDALATASNAVTAGDDVQFAVAKGLAWSAILRGAMAETLAATQAGDATTAASWLLIREFRPTTKFSRPGANATLAIQSLKNGEISPDEAVAGRSRRSPRHLPGQT